MLRKATRSSFVRRDPENNSALLLRDAVRFDPNVRKLLRAFWILVDRNGDGAIDKDEYMDLHLHLYATVNVELSQKPRPPSQVASSLTLSILLPMVWRKNELSFKKRTRLDFSTRVGFAMLAMRARRRSRTARF